MLKTQACLLLGPNQLQVKEITGLYSLEDNETGWGTPNYSYEDVDNIKVSIENIFTNQYFEFFPELPEDPVDTIVWGPYDNIFDDGILELKYIVTFNDEYVATFCNKSFHMLKVQCCIDNLALTYLQEDKLNEFQYSKILLEANAILMALKSSALSLNEARVKYYLNKLNTFCKKCASVE